LLDANILQQANEFIASLNKHVLDRAVMWSYLSETQGSYAIERESPSASKAEVFASLLARAQHREILNEDYLVSLQNLAVSNPIDKAVQFRTQQNWLRNGLTGTLGVTYFPPPADHIMSIMNGVIELANNDDPIIDPLVRGALSSFGFVFAHPFMDGNGRLSRFLFHKVVCSSGKLQNAMVLPISIAMKRNEAQYLLALESFSKPARAKWKVLFVDDQRVDAQFNGDIDIYRYWDATHCVTFGLQMAQQALDQDLRQESDFLQRFDIVYKAVNESIDMNNNDLVVVVRSCLQNNGYLSNNRRKQLLSKGHSEALIDNIQDIIQSSISNFSLGE
jgi:Fic/DOC family